MYLQWKQLKITPTLHQSQKLTMGHRLYKRAKITSLLAKNVEEKLCVIEFSIDIINKS